MTILDPWTKIWAARTRIWDKNGSVGDQFRVRKRLPLIVCYRRYIPRFHFKRLAHFRGAWKLG